LQSWATISEKLVISNSAINSSQNLSQSRNMQRKKINRNFAP
jgi:hypothetical protein